MSAHSPSAWVKKLHMNLTPGTFKHSLGEFLESRKVEVLIIVLVLCDVALLGVEHGIDRHMLCIDGAVTPVAPNDLAALGHAHHEEHGPGLFLQESTARPATQLRTRRVEADRDAWLTAAETEGTEFAQGWMFMQEASKPLVVEPRLVPHKKSQDAGHINKVGAPYRVVERVGPPGSQPRPVFEARAAESITEHGAEHAKHTHAEHEGGSEHQGAEGHGHGADEHGHGHHEASLVCETRHGPQSHEIEHFCHMASIWILAIFLVEILGKLWVNTHDFLRSPVEMLDLVVVSVSLFVDVIVIPMIKDPETRGEAELVVAVLIVCRFWRVVRIFHGAFEVVHHQIEHEEKLNHRIHELEDALRAIRPYSEALNENRKDEKDAEAAHEELEADKRMISGGRS